MTLVIDEARPEVEDKVESATKAKSLKLVKDGESKPDLVLINIRFNPDATIFTIDGRPRHLSAQDWFRRLWFAPASTYQTFAGGRGHFRIPRRDFEALVSEDAA